MGECVKSALELFERELSIVVLVESQEEGLDLVLAVVLVQLVVELEQDLAGLLDRDGAAVVHVDQLEDLLDGAAVDGGGRARLVGGLVADGRGRLVAERRGGLGGLRRGDHGHGLGRAGGAAAAAGAGGAGGLAAVRLLLRLLLGGWLWHAAWWTWRWRFEQKNYNLEGKKVLKLNWGVCVLGCRFWTHNKDGDLK